MAILYKTEKTHETSYVTISEDEYESMKSTLEILADKELMGMMRKSEKEFEEGKGIPLEEFIKELEKTD